MAVAEFEEKEYECFLYSQLLHGSRNVWSPGQVLESAVGLDYAMFTAHALFWGIHKYEQHLPGVVLDDEPMKHWWGHRVSQRQMPDFSLNLFLQAKRPSGGKRVSKALATAGLKSPYWKFNLTDHQQAALQSLARAAAGRALVCYAAPAFDRYTALYAHNRAGTMVSASTFPSALALSAHDTWYYDAPGCSGVANPVIERIDEPPLGERIAALVAEAGDRSNSRAANGYGIKELAASIAEALEADGVGDTSRAAVYFDQMRQLDTYLDFQRPIRNVDLIRSFLAVAVFARNFQLRWYVLGQA